MGKVISRENITELVRNLQRNGKKVVLTNGCFDILHVGHVRYLQKTKTYGDYMVVLLNSDLSVRNLKGPTRPVNNETDRSEVLSALSCVDYVVLFDENSPASLMDEIKPDIYTKGADYTIDTLPEKGVVLKNNIEVKFIDFVEGKSTTQIIDKINSK